MTDERYLKIVSNYEQEQKEIKQSVTDAENKLEKLQQQKVDLRMFLKGIREFSEMKQLTPEIVNTLIKRIEVHNNDKYDGHCHVKVDIYFTAIGMFTPPTEAELAEEMSKIEAKQAI